MSVHTGLPVKGYNPQSTDKVALVNANKEAEERVLRLLDKLGDVEDIDRDFLAEGRLSLITGFMLVNRSIFKPGRVALPEDVK